MEAPPKSNGERDILLACYGRGNDQQNDQTHH
jgi:hypothetical protein